MQAVNLRYLEIFLLKVWKFLEFIPAFLICTIFPLLQVHSKLLIYVTVNYLPNIFQSAFCPLFSQQMFIVLSLKLLLGNPVQSSQIWTIFCHFAESWTFCLMSINSCDFVSMALTLYSVDIAFFAKQVYASFPELFCFVSCWSLHSSAAVS